MWHDCTIDGDDQLGRYSDAYLSGYDFEKVMVRARQNAMLTFLPADTKTVVEVGCGADLLAHRLPEDHDISHWIIVEPDEGFVALARDRVSAMPFVTLIEGRMEDSVATAIATAGGRVDVVVCSSVLHEVSEPLALLRACREVLRPNGRVPINVPNAQSLHRRLAVAAGLIEDVYAPSERNIALAQRAVFDRASLDALVTAAGFEAVDRGGYLLKPFTHKQMADLSFIDDRLLTGLERLGAELPDLASEIFTVGVPAT